jgi:lysozyme family protein
MGNFAKDLKRVWENEFGNGPAYEDETTGADQPTMRGLIGEDLMEAIVAGIVDVGTQLEDLTEEQCEDIYRFKYWDAYRLDEVPEPQAGKVFDSIVSLGPVSIRFWQQALNEEANAQIAQDGICGPKTRFAAKYAATTEKDSSVLARLRELLLSHVEWLVRKNPERNEQYAAGWIARAKQ